MLRSSCRILWTESTKGSQPPAITMEHEYIINIGIYSKNYVVDLDKQINGYLNKYVLP